MQMDRSKVFGVLAFEVNELAAMAFGDLAQLCGTTSRQQLEIDAHQVAFEYRFRWADEQHRVLEVNGRAHGANWWQTERLETRLMVNAPSPSTGDWVCPKRSEFRLGKLSMT